jgi:RNA polymerase sigma-70 factor, ECF subfamily
MTGLPSSTANHRGGRTHVTVDPDATRADADVTVVPPLAADPIFVAAVDEAVIGEVFADSPEAQPDRKLVHATDFSSLYIRHRSSLAVHARRFLNDSRDIDEVVQETFLRLFLAISEIETELQAIAFARRTLTNLCIDRYRAERRRPRLVNLDEGQIYDLEDDADIGDPVLRAEDAAVVREALALLSPLHRAALVKREIEEKSLPQIAVELDVPEESVKHLLFRARRALRRLLVGTSVEPGVELSPAEIVGIANRRAGRAVLQSANALIILFVGALLVAVGIRPVLGRSPVAAISENAPEAGTTASGSVLPSIPPTTPPAAASGHQATPGGTHKAGHGSSPASGHPHVAPSQVPAAPPSTTTIPTPVVHRTPTSPPPSAPPGNGGHSPGGSSRFKLSGPLRVTGPPQVQQVVNSVGADDATTSVTQFSAVTNEGTFALTQSLTQPESDGPPTVAVTPAFIIGNSVTTPQLMGTSASVVQNPDGTFDVSVVAATQPDPSTNVFPLSSVDAHFVLSADLSHVIRESVSLQASSPNPTTSPAPTRSPSPTSSPSAPGSATNTGAGSATGATLAVCPAGGDTPATIAPVAGLADPRVIGISTDRGDDQGMPCAFYTPGGSLSRVPITPTAP